MNCSNCDRVSPPHFHTRYGEHELRVEISSGKILSGKFPTRAEQLVLEWHGLHRDELVKDWDLAQQRKALQKIEPLE